MDMMGNRTVRDLLLERGDRRADIDFAIFEGRDGRIERFSYADALARIRRVAAALFGLGLRKGDAVVLHLGNSPEFLFSWLALMWIGVRAVPSNTANTVPELIHVMNLSDAIAVMTSAEYLDPVTKAAQAVPTVKHVVLSGAYESRTGTILLEDLVNSAPIAPEVDVEIGSEDVAELIFTSGTTSKPKAVMITHANCLHAGEEMAKALALDADDRLATTLPLFHVNAQAATVLTALAVGGTAILLEGYSASNFMHQLRAHRATSVSLVAMQLRTLLAQPPRDDDNRHAIRRCFYALPVTGREKDEFERRFGIELTYGYGLSEAMMLVTMAPLFGGKRWPSIGLPTINRRVRIVDDQGQDVPIGTPGELIVAGEPSRTLMAGYFRDPEATMEALRDGWLYTGDSAKFDEYGYVYFVDRKKDMIKRAGENISASEVEAVLLQYPHVREAAVIGVPDPIRDEAVKAFIACVEGTELDEAEIVAHCRKQLAEFKIPTSIEFVDALPKTSIGKIEKKLLRGRGLQSERQ